ncbi:expressed unknown protein [Seminavis robusta]|uniref:Uncharacterized protein n=1 Tax=Seminavis robusta TaxID=568900 RepID=A0A9N8EDC2_9STRA|nr:expressed unknown protein [Seminavis robusta]|eukprot:Sro958_g224630.1 n/a (403) ;mRNA; r:18134-19342
MAVPSATTLPRGAAPLRGKKKVRYDIVVGLVLLAMVSVTYSIVKPTLHIVKEQQVAEQPLQKIIDNKPVETVDSELLANEQLFLDTIKSCIPGQEAKHQKCGTYIPPDNGDKQRIAVIAPPGQMSEMLWHWIDKVRKKHQKALDKIPMEFIRTSHVPPYGYGKTHGLSKIIRLVPRPLVMGVADALQQIIVDGEQNHHHQEGEQPLALHQQDITLNDLKAVLRQLMRFHCRLSKVAAHTAIFSVNLNDFMDNIDEATQKLYDFLKHSPDKKVSEQDELDDMMQQMGAMDGGMDDVGMLSSELGFVSKILTRIQAESSQSQLKVLTVLDEVLRDEMWKTKNMTTWPCESFFSVGEANARTELSLFATKIGRGFAPNCSAPFAQCWVDRDKCEAEGDGVCKGKK